MTAARIAAWINIALVGLVIVGSVLAVAFLGSTSTETMSDVGSSIERVAVTVHVPVATPAPTP